MSEEHYALILAGGSGSRFWPLSRHRRPKQLLRFFDEETLIEKTLRRLDGVLPPENILILTNAEQEPEVRKVVTSIPPENILSEPAKRDTAPAVALGVGWVARKNPKASMAILPSDQLIQDEDAYKQTISDALKIAQESSSLFTIGIKPTWPCPSYGYVERGAEWKPETVDTNLKIYEVLKFREKPAPELAEQYLEAGNFTWNAGMFIWSIEAVTNELKQHCPELTSFIEDLKSAPDMDSVIENQFPTLPKTSIDYALMENAAQVCNIEATFDWDDVGGWPSVAKYLTQDDNGNSVKAELCTIDAQGNIVYSDSDQQIALLGVRDLIVVQTGDALLVAHRDHADDIKKLVDRVPKELQ